VGDDCGSHMLPAEKPRDPRIGELIAERYRLTHRIGVGGMGAVYAAEHVQLGKTVVVKLLQAESAGDTEISRRLAREAWAAAQIGSEHVVDVYDVGITRDGSPFLVMELLQGRDLHALLAAEHTLSPTRAAHMFVQVCDALSVAHARGIVHRDIKPSNIFLIEAHRDRDFVKLLDFGIARPLEPLSNAVITRTGNILGTPAYMAPEQARGAREIDHRVDIFAAGAALYEALTGQLPFAAPSMTEMLVKLMTEAPASPRALRPELPAALDALVLRALAKQPEQRFQSCDELRCALVPFLERDDRLARMPEPLRLATHKLAQAPSHLPPTASLVAARPALVAPASSPVVAEPSLLACVPREFGQERQAIAEFLGMVFTTATPLSADAVALHGCRLRDTDYEYFALLVPHGCAEDDASDPTLGTRTFAACALPLELQLARLPMGSRKVVIAISNFLELGPGVRKKIFEYRSRFDAIVVPLYAGEIRRAQRDGELRALFDERVATLHPSENLYLQPTRPDPSRLVGMNAQLHALVVALRSPEALVIVDGLPGAGKTSLIARAEYDIDEPFARVRCVSSLQSNLDELVEQMAQAIEAIPARSSRLPVPDARGSFRAIREHLRSGKPRPVLVLEDADWLLQPLGDEQAEPSTRERYRSFWLCLYEYGVRCGLRVIVSGVRGFVLTRSRLLDWENPLASVCQRCPVAALDYAALQRLVREPGLQMNVHFDPRGLRLIYALSSGHVDIARKLCGEVVEHHRLRADRHRLQRVRVSVRDVARAARRLSNRASTFEDRAFASFTPLEQRVLKVIATRSPRSIDDTRRALPEDNPAAVRAAVDRLEDMQLVAADGRYRITVPLIATWLARYFGKTDREARREDTLRFRWVGLGVLVTAALVSSYYFLLSNRPVEASSRRVDGCVYTLIYPSRVVPGEPFALLVQREQCIGRAASNAADALVLRPRHGTIPRLAGAYWPELTIALEHGSAELRLAVDEGTSDSFGFELRKQSSKLLVITIGTNWLGALGQRAQSVAKVLTLIPALLGFLATFFGDLRGQLGRLRDLLRAT
jgi:tRNA A-37 threonylcarbamoyl transferase component Bud32